MRNMNNEQGRSMIEMLGVLAIVGVLSVAGIQGYSKAMGKYKINQVMDEVSTIAANVKTLFASNGQYTDLKNGNTANTAAKAGNVAVDLGLIPDNMTRTDTVLNAMNGTTIVNPTSDGRAFTITMGGITDEGCITLVTSDWGGTSGYKGIKIGSNTLAPTATADERFSYAVTNCTDAANNTIEWTFY